MILVTGATGRVGRAVVTQLLSAGEHVRVLSREGVRPMGLDARVEVVRGDLGQPDSLPAAMRDVERLFLQTPGPTLVPAAHALDAAKHSGVRHVVTLSALSAGMAPLSLLGQWHRDREQLLETSGLAWTAIRPGACMSDALQWAASIRAEGAVYHFTGDGRVAPIDASDIARVAVTALTQPGHEGRTYELTGAELLSVGEQVRILSSVLGRPLRGVNLSVEAAASLIRKTGCPPLVAEAVVQDSAQVRAGKAAVVTPTVEQMTGQRPRSFEAWCQAHSQDFLGVTTDLAAAAHVPAARGEALA
ncbi:SDR family oxidoreductase [Myxococcaceae bacterium JPH2]|nr:SDR family oxidoreductase [Myxococcaceae bacterium JPH2]